MTDFVLNRNHTLRSLSGHIINFKKNEPVYVPPVCHKEAAMFGAVPVEGEVNILGEEKVPAVELTPDERHAELITAFKMLEERNNREDFTGQGVPSVKALKAIVEFDTSRAEIEPLWRAYQEEKGTAE